MGLTTKQVTTSWPGLAGGLVAILLAAQPGRGDGFRRVGPEIQFGCLGVLANVASYDPDADQYLVLWQQYGGPHVVKKGRCIDAGTGGFAAPEFQVAEWVGLGGVAYNSSLHCWFTVHETAPDVGGDIYGQKLNAAGNLGDPILMVQHNLDQGQPCIAHDPMRNRYLVAWTDYQGLGPDIHAQLFDPNGLPIPGHSWLQVSEYSIKSQTSAKTVYNRATDEFLVVWSDLRNDIYRTNPDENNNNYQDIYGQRINASTGALIGANIPVATPFVPGEPYVGDGMDGPYAIVCNTRAASGMYGTYFVGIQKLSDLGWTTQGQILDGQGNHYDGGGPFDISHPSVGAASGAVYNPLDDGYVTTYHNRDYEVAATEFSATGQPLAGPNEVVAHPEWEENFGSLALRPGDGQHLQITVLFENFATHERPWSLIAQRFVRDQAAPAPVTGFAASADAGLVRLVWTNPADADFTGTVIRCSTAGYPTGPTDGFLLADQAGSPGSNGHYLHERLIPGTRSFYAAFAHDDMANYSAPAPATAVPSAYTDFDADGDADQEDFGHLQVCLSDEGLPFAEGCEDADLDLDADVDALDVAVFQICRHGPKAPADPACPR